MKEGNSHKEVKGSKQSPDMKRREDKARKKRREGEETKRM